ncbi:hypothetical protein L210DRAFT_3570453 [Boletus edulis BED1]|uniref:Uncharacterized protein n=1 Tax=Boletus edulis BED1 TaxID=1328754 RepID=A0AAD4G7F7_BOLED|nr:hypothetical protein L210DRAFT_3570453 [Boletus edulis BED1]
MGLPMTTQRQRLAHPSSSPTQTSPSLPPSHATTTTRRQQQRLAHVSSSPGASGPHPHATPTTGRRQRLAHALSSPSPTCDDDNSASPVPHPHPPHPPSLTCDDNNAPPPSPSLSLILTTIMTDDAPALTLFLVSTTTTMTPPPLPSHPHLPSLQERVRNRQLNWQPSLRWPTHQCQLTAFCSYQNFSISSSISWVETPTSLTSASANDGPKWPLTSWKEVDDLLHLFRPMLDSALRHSQKQTTGSDSKSMPLAFGP